MLKQFVRGSGKQIKKVEIADKESGEKRIVRTVVGGHKIGLLVATLNKDDNIVIGHSKWNQRADTYNAELAESVALDRLNRESKTVPALSLHKAYTKFVDRAKRYFDAPLCKATQDAGDTLKLEIDIQRHEQLEVNRGTALATE